MELHPGKPPLTIKYVRMMLPAYRIICVREVSGLGRPLYRVRWVKQRTLDRRYDTRGWIDSADLMATGVILSY